jgi:hypothetical protein
MATTYIDTNQCARLFGQGSVAEIVNRALCGREKLLGCCVGWLRRTLETETCAIDTS